MYEVDIPGIEFWMGEEIYVPVQTGPEAKQPPVTGVQAVSRGVKQPGRGIDHLPLSSAEVKETVELYL